MSWGRGAGVLAAAMLVGALGCGPAETTGVGDAGGPRHALRFDGDGDQIELPMSLGDHGWSFTFEAWVRPTASGGSAEGEGAMIFVHRADCTDLVLEWSGTIDARLPDRFRFRVYPDDSCAWSAAESATTSALGEWHHVAGIFDVGTLSLYVDGELAGTAGLGEAPSWTSSLIGHWIGRDGSDARPDRGAFVGDVDEVRLSEGVRYSGASFDPPAHLDADATTFAAWLIDEGSGTTTRDESAASYDGTITGATWVPADR